MLRRVCFLLLTIFGTVLGVTLAVPGMSMAAAIPGNSITFVNVSPTSCTPSSNESIQINIRYSVAPNDTHRVDTWTISNPRTGASRFANASPAAYSGSGGITNAAGFMLMAVPAGTQTGDLLNLSVHMVSLIGKQIMVNSASGIFNCSTGQFVSTTYTTNVAPALRFPDGRFNQQPEQSVAVYSDNTGGYNFWSVNKGVGTLTLHVTKTQLDASPANGQTYLIVQQGDLSLYRLANGGLEVARAKPDGKMYVFDWTAS